MSGDIPLKVRVGIRDQWDSPTAPVRNSMDSLTKALGHVITPQVEWPTLYASLKDAFSEPSTFVPAICRIAIAFYGRLFSRLDKEPDMPWTESFLEGMGKSSNWKLRMVVSDDKDLQRPQLVWDVDAGHFCIQVPRCKPAGNAVIEAGFDEDLDAFFGGASKPSPNRLPTLTEEEPESELTKEDNWTDIGGLDEPRTETPRQDASTTFIPFPQALRKILTANKVEDLPAVDMVSRPAKLFKSVAPYVLTVTNTKIPLLIHGSHQPSLEYIANYLKKWARVDQNNTMKKTLLVETVESAFFSDVIDTITVEPNYFRGEPEPLNPALILGFIEGVLGYEETFTNGTRWVFKLDPESHSETSLLERNRRII